MEQVKNKKALMGAFAASLMLAATMGVSGCASSTSSTTAASSSAEAASSSADAASSSADATSSSEASGAAAPGEAAGFTEIPIFEGEEAGFLSVNAVYFQPVPMTDGTSIEGYDLHLEADVSALENEFGFGVGDWVPYLTVDYKITGSDGQVAAEGTFMPMSASDGPHYGANIALPKADTYDLEFTFRSPQDLNYQLHTDAETGPGASGWEDVAWPLTVKYSGWDYTPQEW